MRGDRNTNPLAEGASSAVHEALRTGRLRRPTTCQRCGGPGVKSKDGRFPIQAHHEDHRRKLDIVWLCSKCHFRAEKSHWGERNPRAILTTKAVKEIRGYLLAKRFSHRQLAVTYGVSMPTISAISTGRNWRNVKP